MPPFSGPYAPYRRRPFSPSVVAPAAQPQQPQAAPEAGNGPLGGFFDRAASFRDENPGVLATFGAGLMGSSPMAPALLAAAKMRSTSTSKAQIAKLLLDKGLADTPEEAMILAGNPALVSVFAKDNTLQNTVQARMEIAKHLGLTGEAAQRYAATGTWDTSSGSNKVSNMTPEQRLQLYAQQGGDPNSPEARRFALTGGLDSASSRGLNSTELKLKSKAEDELPAFDYMTNALDQAEKLLPNVETGFTSGARAKAATGLGSDYGGDLFMDPKKAQATKQYNDILNEVAARVMSETLKGSTTNYEMQHFLSIIADTNNPIELRRSVLQRFKTLAKQEADTRRHRIAQLSAAEDGTGGISGATDTGGGGDGWSSEIVKP